MTWTIKTTGKTSEERHKEWLKNSDYVEAYQELEPEFTMASALIEARTVHSDVLIDDPVTPKA